jgi:hypothetical protein
MDYIVLGLVVAFCIGYLFTRDTFTALLLSNFRYNISLDSDEQEDIRFSRTFLLTYTLAIFAYFITSSTTLLSPLPPILLGVSKPLVFVGVLGVLLAWSTVRFFALRFIGWVIEYPSFTSLLERTGRDYAIMAGFAFIPFLLLFALLKISTGNALLIIGLTLVFLSCLFHAIRSLRIFLSAGFSVFFWILYLCTLEIIPLGVLIYLFAGIRL